jgi:hypothetical protein
VFAWIETRSDPKNLPVRPEHTRAEVWMALIRGATAIGYRGFENYKMDVRPDPEMMAELKRLNAQLARLAPALLADPAEAKVEMALQGGLACHLKATQLDGAITVFAQNIDLGADAATITVEGLKAGTQIEVLDEGRTLAAQDGRFTDRFAPLAEHVYRFRR